MVGPYINVEKDSLITLKSALECVLEMFDKKSQEWSDSNYELEQINKELKMR